MGKQICATCPVKIRCAEYAMTRKEPHGTWGGVTEWERHFLLTGKVRKK
jgi:WhiB family redox-sensing transcriptional regulator